MTKKKKTEVVEYIEAQLEFDPKELGGTIFSEYDVRIYKAIPQDKNNVALTAIISKKGAIDATRKRKIEKNDFKKH